MFEFNEFYNRTIGNNYTNQDTHYRVIINGHPCYLVPIGIDYNCDGGHEIKFMTPEEYAKKFIPEDGEMAYQLMNDLMGGQGSAQS